MNATVATSANATVQAPRAELMLLTTLAGSFLANLTAQFASANLADIQGSLGASADEASWIGTVYTMASVAGILLSGPLAKALGLRRYFLGSASVLALTAWLATLADSLPPLLVLRALQGLAAGGFGPMAFLVVFMMFKGPRLPFALALLAFTLLVAVTAGPVLSAPIETAFGWRGLFVAQAWAAMLLLVLGTSFLPRAPLNWSGLKGDWAAIALLATAIAALMLFLSQGTRRFWLDSSMIVWSLAMSVGALLGFVLATWFSPTPVVRFAKLRDRRFSLPIALNLAFRASFAVTVYLVPQLLATTLGYRPLETASALLWGLVPQVLAFPLVWHLQHRLDSRTLMIAGFVLCGAGTVLAGFSTSQVGAEQVRLTLALFGAGQMFVLVPTLLIGATSLKPEDLPTGSLAFNLTTLAGTTLGVGLASNFVTEREKFHSNVLTEHVSTLSLSAGDRLAGLASTAADRISSDALASAGALVRVASTVRREAWLLAINDAFVVIGLILAATAFIALLIGRSPPLPRAHTLQRDAS